MRLSNGNRGCQDCKADWALALFPSRFAAFVHFWTMSLWLTVVATCSQTGPTTWAEPSLCHLWSLSPYGLLWSCSWAREPSDRQEHAGTVYQDLTFCYVDKNAVALHSLFPSSPFLFILSVWRPTGFLFLSWEKNADQKWIQCPPLILITKTQYKSLL